MSLKHSDIISFFIKCVEAESFESFSLPRNKKSIFDLSNHMLGIEKILNGEEPYFIIQGEPNLNKFIAYRNNYKKNDKIFLAVDLIPKKDRSGDSLLPTYIAEVLIEEFQESGKNGNETQTTVRLSTVDIEPTFNHYLLSKSMTIHDRFLLMDEIIEESDWEAKKQLYLNHIDETLSKSIITKPVLFLSSDLHSVQSSVSLELEWINQRFLSKIPDTSLFSIFDRVKKNTPQYVRQRYLEIFPLNRVQRDVVRFALDNPFTVITGPPGTGKSQVVLNLLANIYINGKTVLFGSKNNKAVNTVIEKLESIQAGYCPFIRLGNKKEKQIGLHKIISGIGEPNEINEQSNFFDETEKLSHEIDQLYKKLQKSEDQFNAYCSTVRSIAIKSKVVPSHLESILYDGLLNDIKQYETTCLKLIKDLETCNQDFTKNRKEFVVLRRQLKEKKFNLSRLKNDLKTLYLEPFGALKLPLINEKIVEEFLQFIGKIERQQTVNKNIQIQFDENQVLLKGLKLRQQELQSNFEVFIETSFDHELKSLLENKLIDISESIDVSFFELNQLKADLEKFISIKNRLMSRFFFSIRRPFFKRNCYRRFKAFLTEQPDFISRYSVTKTATLNKETLYEVLSILTKIPECVEHLKNLKSQDYEVSKVQNENVVLFDSLKLENFAWIEEGVRKFSELTRYELAKNKSKNHFDFIAYWHEVSKNLLNLLKNILNYRNLISQIQLTQSEIEMLLPKTNIKHYDFFFDEADRYIQESSFHSKPIFKVDYSNRNFDIYRDILEESKRIFNVLKDLSELDKKCKIFQRQIDSAISTNELESAIAKRQKELVEKSIAIFNHQLSKKISMDKAKFKQTVVDYFGNWKDTVLHSLFESLNQFMGIFVTTNLSTRYNIPNMPALFDFVIIDEASQNDIASVLPLLFRAKHAIVIGDPNQLRHISHLKNHLIEKFAESCKLGPSLLDYHYNKRSAYDLSAKAFQECTGKSPFVLRNHYRCHQDIIQFSNYEFYDSKLFPKTYIHKDISPLKPGISWRNVQGNYKDHSNPNEAYSIIAFIEESRKNGLNDNINIGIIAPFRNQKNLLLSLLSRKRLISGNPNDRIHASTVHSFQGDERDIIIYSPVLSKGINERTQEWLDKSTDLLNVAITRACSALLIFGDTHYCMQTNGMHKKLLNYCLAADESNRLPDFESRSEQVFYEALKSAGLDFEYQVPIGRYRADFILKQEDKFLSIELDGYQHNQTKSYDYSRDRYFEELGYTVLRLPSRYAENNVSEIMSLLKKIVFQNSGIQGL